MRRGLFVGVVVAGCFTEPAPPASDAGSGGGSASEDDGSTLTGSPGESGSAGGCAAPARCMAAPPPGWDLVFAADRRTSALLPQCPAAAPPLLAGGSEVDADPAECACLCAPPGCSVELTSYDDASCTIASRSATHAVFDCVAIGSGLEAQPVDPEGGGCAARSVTILPPPQGDVFAITCGPITATGGCEAGMCVPPGPQGFRPGPCVATQADVECPAGFPERLAVSSFTDERACSRCNCGPTPAGACNGSVALHDSSDCSDPSPTPMALGSCLDTGSFQSVQYLSACPASGGDSIGALQPGDPITICCAG